MRFSRRTAWDRSPNTIAHLLERRPADVLDLTESNPTRTGLAASDRDIAAALADPGNARYEPDPRGLPSAREALARWLAARGRPVSPDRIFLTTSTSEAYAHLFKLCCDAGDAILTPSPGYPLFEHLAQLEEVTAHPYTLRLSDRWRLDLDAMSAVAPERLRAVVTVSPGNPTGAFLLAEEARGLARFARDHGAAIVSDEVFADYAWGATTGADVLAAAASEGALAFVLSGLSKACGLPQLKLGWLVLGGDDGLVAEAAARLDLIADTYLSVSTPVQRGLPRLLELGDAFRARARPRLASNLAVLEQVAAECGARLLPGDGGWSAVLAFPDGAPGEDALVSDLLATHRVFVHPGWLFDLPMPSLVISLLSSPEVMAEAAPRLTKALAHRPRPI